MRQLGIELQRAAARAVRLLEKGLAAAAVHDQVAAALGEPGEGTGVAGVYLQSPVEQLQGGLYPPAPVLEEPLAPLQVVLVGPHVRGRRPLESPRVPLVEAELEPVGDPLGDLALHREDVLQGAIERARPQLGPVLGPEQVGAHLEPLVTLGNRPLEYRGDAELASGIGGIGRAAETKGGAARRHPKPFDARERADQLFGQAVPKVLLIPLGAAIGEGQDGNGRDAHWRPRTGQRCVSPLSAAAHARL